MGNRDQTRPLGESEERFWDDREAWDADDQGITSRYDRSLYVSGGPRNSSSAASRRRPLRRQHSGYDAASGQDGLRDDYQEDPLPDARGDASGVVSSRSPRRKAFVVLAAIAAIAVVAVAAAFAYMNTISNNLHEGIDPSLQNALVRTDMAKEPFYMLLLGTDGSAERDNDPELAGSYRSDSMILARIDAPKKKVTMISINRDTIIDMGEYGEQKINAAYGIGGATLAVEAVSDLAGVGISHYAQVDFDAFSALVNALGGIEVDVPVDIDDWEAGGAVQAGLQTLSGEEALILCRSRNTYVYTAAHPDQMRAANQRLVLSAIAKKLLSSDIATIASSVQELSQYVTTDLNVTDIIGLAQALQGLDPDTDVYTAMEPTNSEYIDETWCEYIDKKAWAEMMSRVEAGLPPVESAIVDETTGTVLATAGEGAFDSNAAKYSTITVKNGTDISGLAAQTRSKLVDAGFQTVIVGDVADGYQYPLTLVVYNDPIGEHEAEQIVDILGQGSAFLNDGSYLLLDTDYLVVIGEDWQE